MAQGCETAHAACLRVSNRCSQTLSWLQLAMVWATILRSMIQAEVVHRSLARILSQAKVDPPLYPGRWSARREPCTASRRRRAGQSVSGNRIVTKRDYTSPPLPLN